jgi:hypothetical protein
MEIKQITDITSLVIASAALFTSSVTLYKIRQERTSRMIDAHLRFQNTFREIQKGFPPEVNDADANGNYTWVPSGSSEKRSIEAYWQFVFDEWFFCNKGEAFLKVLWDNFYANGVRGALKRPAFKNSLVETLSKNGFMLGHKDTLKDEINRLYKIDYGNNLVN